MSRSRALLLTGFEPFGGAPCNPSADVALALAGLRLPPRADGVSARVVAQVLPCAFGDARQALDEALRRHRPAAVLALGVAQGRAALSLERVALNLDDARIPDNLGRQPVDQPVLPQAPAAYFSTLPVKAMVAGLREAGHAAELSNTAGTFVCNHLFFGLMHALRRRRRCRAGFMHLPQDDRAAALVPAGTPLWPLESLCEGVRLALALAWRHGDAHDLPATEGRLD